ncbi:MAG: thiamine phosphate synthase [Planctomycetota bacterium]
MPARRENADGEGRDRVLRILDANLNRAREALRALEEVFRLGRDDAALASRVKELRHALRAFETSLGLRPGELQGFRDADGDVGRASPAEPHGSLGALVSANARRLEEALRVLEEFGRLLGAEVETASLARFETYELERLAVPGLDLRRRLDACRLYVLLGADGSPGDGLRVAEAALRGGADAIQLRAFSGSDAAMLDAARRLRRICADAGALFFVNDRVDVAWAADADGVHLGQEDLPVEAARRLLGAGRLVGLSTHSDEELSAAGDVDCVGIGAVFPSPLKPNRPPLGPERASDLFRLSPVPAFPIGGIHAGNIGELTAAGVHRAAVSSAVCTADDPEKTARILKEALLAAKPL